MLHRFLPAYLLTFVNVLGFSLVMPVLPFVVEEYGAPKAVYGFLLSCYSFFQFLGAPWLGRLSDSLGRKPVLLISQAGTLLSWVVFGAAWFLPNIAIGWVSLPLIVIACARVFDGMTGGNNSVTQAYVSDITTHQEKGWIFGTMGGIVGVGMIVGPGIGGYLGSTSLGYLGVAICGAFISTLTLISIQLNLKESLPPENRKPLVKQSLMHSLWLIGRIQTLNPPPIIKRIFLVRSLFSSMMASYIATIALYIIDVFKFDARELGLFMLAVGLFISFNQAFVSKRFIRKFGELSTMKIGLFLCVIGLFAITLTKNLGLYICFYYILNLGISLSIPTFNALIAQNAPPKDTGEIMGIGDSIISLSNALFPILAASAYGFLGETFYHLIAVLPAMGLFLALQINLAPSELQPILD
ncbi:MAG: MFS transporter [Myxococcota bacterium]|nr:MFS transporter [Myxococcota bacterium]